MAVVTTGFFDGVHIGHRHVLEAVVSCARERGEEAVVVTFWPHPRTVLQQDARDLRLLSSLEEKKALLAAAGIDRVEVLPFTRAFAAMTAAEYLQMLRDKFGATVVVMGNDNRIGSERLMAGQMKSEWPIKLVGEYIDSAQSVESISSTQIRKTILAGEIEKANAMLGYNYGLYGVVVAGNRLGRTIGFPTANILPDDPHKVIPKCGVYEVEVRAYAFTWTPAMLNIDKNGTIEVYIPSFQGDLYDQPLDVRFIRFIREERQFDSLDELQQQIKADVDNIRHQE